MIDLRTITRKLEKVSIRNKKKIKKIIFNKLCISNNLFPKYTTYFIIKCIDFNKINAWKLCFNKTAQHNDKFPHT